ncbi:MAG TPA: hypothetical protein VIG73_06945 [Cerasibacillus sp.]|uniref:hypothetical protein n=1 Tax=Cerasibacillus sp. TaxID=2498711 RepID=UPI002F3F05F0
MKPSTLWAYTFLSRQRFKKKMNIYQLTLRTVIDKTIAFYLSVFFGYLFMTMFVFGNVLSEYEEQFLWMQSQGERYFYLLIAVIPFRYIFLSFRHPGVMFSSSEYQLSLLPYSRQHIWFLSFLNKVIKKLLVMVFFGFGLFLLTPINGTLILNYFGMFFLIDLGMTIPQWFMFQRNIFIKMLFWFLFVTINSIAFFVQLDLFTMVTIIGVLIFINIWFYPRLFVGVDWGKVMTVCDYHLWNMAFVSRVSQVRIKPQRKYSLMKKLSYRKKPFRYTFRSIHHRIWQIAFIRNIEYIIQLVGVLVLMLAVLNYIPKTGFMFIGIAVALYVYAAGSTSFFINQFQADLVEVLPWDLMAYKQSFLKWYVIGSLPILMPMITYFTLHFTWWVPVQFILILLTGLYIYHVEINYSIAVLSKAEIVFVKARWVSFVFLCIVIGSSLYPMLACFFPLIFPFLTEQRSFSLL